MCERLETAGAVSVTLEDAGDDPQLEPEPGATPLWPHLRVRALYEHPAGPEAARAALPAGPAVTNVRVRRIDDRDWLAASREDIVPIGIGALWIGPHWADPPPDRVVVRLEPDSPSAPDAIPPRGCVSNGSRQRRRRGLTSSTTAAARASSRWRRRCWERAG